MKSQRKPCKSQGQPKTGRARHGDMTQFVNGAPGRGGAGVDARCSQDFSRGTYFTLIFQLPLPSFNPLNPNSDQQ